MARPDSWMPVYIGDFLADSMHLNTEQSGAYLLLIFHYWRHGGPLRDDDATLASVTRLSPARWRKHRAAISSFFNVSNGLWSHGRIEAELKSANEGYAMRLERSRLANKARSEKASLKDSLEDTSEDTLVDTVKGTQPQPQPQRRGTKEKVEKYLPAVEKTAGLTRGGRKTQIAPDWKPDEWDIEHAEAKGWDRQRIDREAEGFRDRNLAHAAVYSDWSAAWRTWVRNADKFAGRGPVRGSDADQADRIVKRRRAIYNSIAPELAVGGHNPNGGQRGGFIDGGSGDRGEAGPGRAASLCGDSEPAVHGPAAPARGGAAGVARTSGAPPGPGPGAGGGRGDQEAQVELATDDSRDN